MIAEHFKKWLENIEGKKVSTAGHYSSAINKLSEHYSKYKGKRFNLYEINNLVELKELKELYNGKGKFSEIGDTGHGTYRAAINALYRYRNNKNSDYYKKSHKVKQKSIKQISNILNDYNSTSKLFEKGKYTYNNFDLQIDQELRNEAQMMSKHYEIFYSLERSIRNLIVKTMSNKYGENWWDNKISFDIKRSVNTKIEYELGSILTKQSNREIDYTTFGELRKIIASNWGLFSNKFNKDKTAFNRIMTDLNKLRNPIAHCTPFIEKEVTRLNLTVDDWFEIYKK